MVYNFRAARVAQTARRLAETKVTARTRYAEPAWLKAVEAIPPAEILTRPYPIQHTEPNRKARKPRNLYRPTKMVYPEDELRRDFYKDHPWELARPRMILESDGKDAQYRDWSTGLRQPGMALSGECVVQRQLWLMENKGMTKQQAYDLVRHEFYKLRQREEIENRVVVEEARMVGAYFGKNRIQVGIEVEDVEYEHWRKWAGDEIKKLGEADSATRSLTSSADADDAMEGLDDVEEPDLAAVV